MDLARLRLVIIPFLFLEIKLFNIEDDLYKGKDMF